MDGGRWLLLNASPDIGAQIEAFPEFHPGAASERDSPVREVLLTNADLDHVLGLFQLREHGERLRIRCTPAIRDTLRAALRMDHVLKAFCGVEWLDFQDICRAIPLPAEAPRYASALFPSTDGQSVALEFADPRSGTRLLFAPDVAAVTPELRKALERADAILFDGTFWDEDELRRVDPKARTSSEMGHLSISDGSLEVLRGLRARRVYVHINNTNPVLRPGSPERAQVEAAGIVIGEDKMEFEL